MDRSDNLDYDDDDFYLRDERTWREKMESVTTTVVILYVVSGVALGYVVVKLIAAVL